MSQKNAVQFFTNANCTQKFFSIKLFFQRMWWSALRLRGPSGPTPIFWKKTFHWKELLCAVCVCKKWDWRFLKHLAVLTLWICACLSICSLQKDWIRIFWTFIDSKKVNPCFFCSCVLLQKKCIRVSILSLKKMKFFLFESLLGFC